MDSTQYQGVPMKATKYETYYATEDGRIISIKGSRMLERKAYVPKSGYKQLTLSVRGKPVNIVVHQLVAETYIGKCPEGLTVNHKDGNKLNNFYTNYEHITGADNTRHAFALGLIPIIQGEDHYATKISNALCIEMANKFNSGVQYSDLAKEYGLAIGHIKDIISGKARSYLTDQGLITKVRQQQKYSVDLIVKMIREVISGEPTPTVARRYNVPYKYLHHIMHQKKRLDAWKVIETVG